MSNEELIAEARWAADVARNDLALSRSRLLTKLADALECLSVPSEVPPVTREALLALIVAHNPDDSHPDDQRRCICGELIGESDGVIVTTDPYGHLVDCILKSLSVSPPAEVTEHKISQQIPWPPSPDSEYMLSRFECSCGWVGGTFKDLRSNSVERAAYRGQADAHSTPPAEVEWEYGIQGRSRVNPMPSEVLARGTIAVCSPEMAEKDLRQRWVTRGPWVPVVVGDQK